MARNVHQQKMFDEYNANPKVCLCCGKTLPYEKRTNTFCNSSCAMKYLKGNLTEEELRKRKADYLKKYAQENKERLTQYKKNYYIEHREVVREYGKVYRQEHHEELQIKKKQYREEHGYGQAICESCGGVFIKRGYKQRICKPCLLKRNKILGAHSSSYTHTSKGFEHRVVMQEAGVLTPELEAQGYMVHHIDGNRSNNLSYNLMVMTKSEHSRLHRAIEKEWVDHQDMSMIELTGLVVKAYGIQYIPH